MLYSGNNNNNIITKHTKPDILLDVYFLKVIVIHQKELAGDESNIHFVAM